MNRIVLSSVLVLWIGISQVFSQEIVDVPKIQLQAKGGVRLDANMSHFILLDFDEAGSRKGRGNSKRNQRGFGLSVGGYGKVDITNFFALRSEVLLHYKTSKLDEKKFGVKANYQYFGVEIPIHALFQANNRRCFIGTGAYFGFGIDARYKFNNKDDLNLYKKYNGQKSELNRFDFGIASIVGHEFFNTRLQLVITCKVGLINLLNANKDNARMRLHTLSLGLGYRLN